MPYHLTYGDRYLSIEEDDFWQAEWGKKSEVRKPFYLGEGIDRKYLPSSGYFESKRTTYPPFVMIPYLMCDEDVKVIIEQYEPGQHNFFPFEIRNSKRGDVVTTYYIVNIVSNVSAIDVERSDPEVVKLFPKRPDGTQRAQIDRSRLTAIADGQVEDSTGIVLKPGATSDSHLWVDRLTPTSADYFISDELYEKLKPLILKNYFRISRTN